MAKNRELSQLGSFVVVNDTNGNIGIATTATPSVGIGTTNPQAKLHVVSDAIIGNVKVTSGIVTSANPGVTTVVYYGDGSNLFGVSAFSVVKQPTTTTTVFPTFANNIGVNSVGIATTGSTSFVYTPATGNVGLGSTQPAYKVDAVGDINITGTFRVDGRSVLDDALIYSIVFG